MGRCYQERQALAADGHVLDMEAPGRAPGQQPGPELYRARMRNLQDQGDTSPHPYLSSAGTESVTRACPALTPIFSSEV